MVRVPSLDPNTDRLLTGLEVVVVVVGGGGAVVGEGVVGEGGVGRVFGAAVV